METINNLKLNESYTTETLDNGLRIFYINKPGFTSSTAVLAVPYGSLDVMQKLPDGSIHTTHPGIAHFLEHKLFESNSGQDVMESFSKMSASVNAFTSFNETAYYFTTSEPEFTAPLNLLLDFVQELSISDDSVEKEKGIITQELRMYMQMPEARLMFETYRSLFVNHPVRLDIGGTEESVSAITKDELTQCYNGNYHPKNSVLVIVSGLDSEPVINAVKANQATKKFPEFEKHTRYIETEPTMINEAIKTVEMDITAKKITYSFKFDAFDGSPLDRLKKEWQVRLYLELLFSTYNPKYQTWLDQGRINDYFGFEVDFTPEYGFAMFFGEAENERDFTSLVHEGLSEDVTLFLDHFDHLKKRFYGQAVRSLNNLDDIAVTFARCIFQELDYFDYMTLVNELRQEDILEAKEMFDFNRSTLCILKGKSE